MFDYNKAGSLVIWYKNKGDIRTARVLYKKNTELIELLKRVGSGKYDIANLYPNFSIIKEERYKFIYVFIDPSTYKTPESPLDDEDKDFIDKLLNTEGVEMVLVLPIDKEAAFAIKANQQRIELLSNMLYANFIKQANEFIQEENI